MVPPPFRCSGDSFLSPVCNKTRKEIFVTPMFDEQLEFVHSNGQILGDVKYLLMLEDGSTVEGTTDKKGRTKRVRTKKPVAIKKVQLSASAPRIPSRTAAEASAGILHSCTVHSPDVLPAFLTFELNGIKTNRFEIGKSVVPVKTPDDETRPLTAGEIAMAKVLFKDSINYKNVTVHNGDFIPFGKQDQDTAITPFGSIYFPKKHFVEDFSVSDDQDRHWLIHELVHVWQFQHLYPVFHRGVMHYGLDYKYKLDEKNHLGDYNMEAQGDLLADYWALLDAKVRGIRVTYMAMGIYANDIKIYEAVLRHFLKNRDSWRNWPAFY
ncbi:hypothetical protein [Massilia sp. TSP1-1-2]|uniref:hypothetical protein n=1 Tax=unclassified Massilia TaxID=2609279 RepID=UPI003CF8F260